MNQLYTFKQVANLFALPERQLRYWVQVGLVGPSGRKRGPRFTRDDLVRVRAAADSLSAGLCIDEIRRALDALHTTDERAEIAALYRRVADALGESTDGAHDEVQATATKASAPEPAPLPEPEPEPASLSQPEPESLSQPEPEPDEPDEDTAPTAYDLFREGCEAEDHGKLRLAIQCYERALELEPTFSAALTNLGNLRYQQGDTDGARDAYESALDMEPAQPEARFNLGNLLDDIGEREHAIAELRRVCSSSPQFADAHYNLGLLLASVGGTTQAKMHMQRYLELDSASVWAKRSREFIAAL